MPSNDQLPLLSTFFSINLRKTKLKTKTGMKIKLRITGMKRIALIIISLISVSVISSPTFPFLTAENQFDELIPKAKAFVELMAAEKYSEGVERRKIKW